MKVHPYFLRNASTVVGYLLVCLLIDHIVVYLCCGRKSVKHLDGPNSSFLDKLHHLDVVIQLHLEGIMYVSVVTLLINMLFICFFLSGSCDLHHSHH